MLVGGAGLAYAFLQGFAIGAAGWAHPALSTLFGALPGGQYGMGFGACLVITAFAMLFSLGLAERGYFKGDAFVAGSVVAVGLLVAVFTFFPVARILVQALETNDGAFSLPAFVARVTTEKIWGVGCVVGTTRCGVAWNTLLLALLWLWLYALDCLRADPPPRACIPEICAAFRCCPDITPPFGSASASSAVRTLRPVSTVSMGVNIHPTR